ncbi:MAG: TRAP transporter small permease subunit [Desulfobulbaceae bacterium]|nr:TRAP transporter small permease subunit [Desulfobulbaceae bacterium]
MRAQKALKIVDNLESYLCQILLVFFVCLLFLQIVLRLVFSLMDTLSHYIVFFEKYDLPASLPWGEELSRFAFVWFVYFGATFAARLAAHNRVTFQFKIFPEIVGNISTFLADLIWIAFNTTMVFFSINVIKEGFQYPEYSPTLDWIMAYVFMIFPIAFSLMNIRIIQVNIMKYILKMEIADVDKIDIEERESINLEDEVTP